jgi:hypothetical protein
MPGSARQRWFISIKSLRRHHVLPKKKSFAANE